MVAQTGTGSRAKPAQVYVLRGFAVHVDGRAVVDASWSRKKPQALVTLLALHGTPVPRDAVLSALWPHLNSAAAAANLRKCRHHLRTKLAAAGVDDIVELEGDAYRLRDSVATDVASVRAKTHAASGSGDPALLEATLAAVPSDPFPDGHTEPWAEPFRAELTALRNDLLLDLAAVQEDAGDTDAAIDVLEGLLSEEPAHEPTHRALMRLYASTDQPATALRQYERCKAALRDEVGVDPAAETVELRELVMGSVYRSPESQASPRSGAFVGRSAEMRRLNEALGEALAGRSQAVFVAGDPGAGKSRLMEEFATLATLLGARVVRGQSFADSAPFEPWIQILRQIADRGRLGSGRRSGLNSYVSGPREQGPAESDESQQHARTGLFEDVQALIDASSRDEPLTIVLEDIHAADHDSLALLRHVASVTREAPVIVLCTYRSTSVSAELEHVRESLGREQYVTTLELRPLDEPAARELLLTAAGGHVSKRTTSKLLDRARGNPLFITEFSHMVGTTMARPEAGNRWERPLPRRVRDAIKEHVRQLPEGCRDLLKPASALGIRFRLPVLEEVVGVDAERLAERILPAVEAHVVREVGGGAPEFEFRHPLIGETLYEDLSDNERLGAHQRTAEALTRRRDLGLETSAAELAHHFLLAVPRVDVAQALNHARRAGDEAADALAFEDAVHWYGQALRAIDEQGGVSDDERYGHLMRFALATRRIGDNERSRERLAEAARLVLRPDSADRLAKTLREYLGTHLPAFQVDARLVGLAEEGLALIGAEDSAPRARLLTVLGRALIWSPDRERAEYASRQAIEVARRVDDKEALGYALLAWHYGQRRPDNVDERLRVSTEYLEIVKEQADRDGLAQAHRLHLVDLLQLGDIDGVDADLAAISDLAGDSTPPSVKRHLLGMKSMRALLAGDFEAAEQLALDAHRERRRAQIPDAMGLLGYQLVAIRGEQGRLTEMEPLVRASADEYGAFTGARVLLARIYADIGKHVEARKEFDILAERDFEDVREDQTRLPILAGLALVGGELDDRKRAEVLYDLLLPHATHTAVTSDALVCTGSLSRHLGLLAATLKRWDDSERHFEDALVMNERMKSPPLVARTQANYASMLLKCGDEQRRKRVAGLLAKAEETARGLGMAGLLVDIAVLREAGSSPAFRMEQGGGS